ncbi:uncharacterized protein LOC143349035 [Colletes latitarsis]|uniref:uncharacterized protein LOC143349035 n=1 Tax=Colletes latitarsis TaxID=2605962 RepID=UPI0040357040
MRTGNILEKTLACHMAESLATGSHDLRIADVLATIVADEDKISSFDALSLNINMYDWDSMENELILIECPNQDVEESRRSHRREILTIMNTAARWRTHADGGLLECLFPEETMNMANSVIDEDERASQMVDAIRAEQWDVLGRIIEQCLWY